MRARAAHVAALAALATLASAGCAMLSGASDLGIASSGDDATDGGGEGSSPVESDGSPTDVVDGAAPDVEVDAPAGDAGPDATVTTVRCNGVSCAGLCCITPDGTGNCAPHGEACPPGMMELSCDEKADCPPGQSCCLAFAGGAPRSACAPTCNGGGLETLCGSDQECTTVTDCIPLEMLGPPFSALHGKGGCD